MRISTLIFTAMLLASPFVQATDREDSAGKVIDSPVVANDPATFTAQNDWIEKEMNAGGRYEFIKSGDKQRVMELLGRMTGLLAGHASLDAMDRNTRSQLLDEQEEVNGILKHSDSNRLVCESLAPTGSHIPVKTCHTYAQTAGSTRATLSGTNGNSRQCGKGASQYSSRYASTSNTDCGGR